MMNNKLLKIIKELSINDTKTLSQKALKVSEECGELAKVILPFDNASGTLHRFSNKEKILEEVSDVILSAISIAYDLDFNDSEIIDMLYEKIIKWQKIQNKESKINPNQIPFEIHITIKCPINIDKYKIDCYDIGVKPIVLDLKKDLIDVMTSSKIVGTNKEAYFECIRISEALNVLGYDVIREKIESVTYHPSAPVDVNDKMPENCYFESHIGCLVNDDNEKTVLEYIAKKNNAHLSRNVFKKNEDGSYINMVTYRQYDGTTKSFGDKIKHLQNELDDSGFKYDKIITEFSVYDTKVSHDLNWLN